MVGRELPVAVQVNVTLPPMTAAVLLGASVTATIENIIHLIFNKGSIVYIYYKHIYIVSIQSLKVPM